MKDVEIRERINTDPILKSLNLDFGVDFNRLLAFHGDLGIQDLAFEDYARRLHTLMESLDLEPSSIGRMIERNPLILKNDDFYCIQRWKEITDFLSDRKNPGLSKKSSKCWLNNCQKSDDFEPFGAKTPGKYRVFYDKRYFESREQT